MESSPGDKKKRERENEPGPIRQIRECAERAMVTWNRKQKSNGDPEYVVTELVNSAAFFDNVFWYHANFKARPKNDPSAEPVLFFVELKFHRVTKVCVLDPMDIGKNNGCNACAGLEIGHPEGEFNLGVRMHTIAVKFKAKKKKLESDL